MTWILLSVPLYRVPMPNHSTGYAAKSVVCYDASICANCAPPRARPSVSAPYF
jgi:hypothetical protein